MINELANEIDEILTRNNYRFKTTLAVRYDNYDTVKSHYKIYVDISLSITYCRTSILMIMSAVSANKAPTAAPPILPYWSKFLAKPSGLKPVAAKPLVRLKKSRLDASIINDNFMV